MSNPKRWIKKLTGSRHVAASVTPSVRSYTGEEMRAWFGPPTGIRHHGEHGADCCCTMARRQVRLAAAQLPAAAPVVAVRGAFGKPR
ncbi:MAG: hypothetical protein HY060_17575 [Proteobacteria bacterium]|nr:hypothetical protein [Pseudomonadota bacterium]